MCFPLHVYGQSRVHDWSRGGRLVIDFYCFLLVPFSTTQTPGVCTAVAKQGITHILEKGT